MSTPCHALVFRDVKEHVSLGSAYSAIAAELAEFCHTKDDESFLSAFLRAAEVETAITESCQESFLFTNFLARGLTDPAAKVETAKLVLRFLRSSSEDDHMVVSRPEGFAFYGLHPLDYADALDHLDISGTQPLFVIGIRTIGLALGYVVVNSLIQRCGNDRSLHYISARPFGHPYDRRCEFDEDQRHQILQALASRFIVVDEGPGLSGSSFLSVAEALVELGVNHGQIAFLCSRKVDSAQLVAPHAAGRWNRFNAHVAERNHCLPEPDAIPKFAGDWRSIAFTQESDWPGLWTAMQPATYQSAAGHHVFEYHGLGHYGDAVRKRINALAVAGFTVPAERAANGFSRSKRIHGRRKSKQDISPGVLDRMAEYLACRARTCSVPTNAVSFEDLDQMTRFNYQQATGGELLSDFHLHLQHPVIADSQMMPYAWLHPDDGGQLLKLDCGTHGDNHFYPGPVDIAWDVAGAIIEWEMSDSDREYFVTRYNISAEEKVDARIGPYITAYTAFRNGYCRMAASALAHDPEEQARLLRDAERYRCVLVEQVSPPIAAAAAYE